MPVQAEYGFDNRNTKHTGGGYGGRMYWIVATGGDTVVVRVDENHFARKHLLLESADATKRAGLEAWDLRDWVSWAWGWGDSTAGDAHVQEKHDEYVARKSKNRVEHRASVAPFAGGAVAPIGAATPLGPVTAERQRWSDKYRGNPLNPPANPLIGPALPVADHGEPGRRNSAVNLVTQSQNSIDRHAAAMAIANILNGLPPAPGAPNTVHDHGHVAINFNQQCVINVEFNRRHGATITGTSQGINVGVNEAIRTTPNKRSFSIYHLIGTF